MRNQFIAQIPTSPQRPPQSGQISITIEQILLGSAIAIGGVTVAVVKWFVSRSIKEYENTIDNLEGDIKRLKDEEIGKLKDSLHNQQRTSDIRAAETERRFVELNSRFVDKDDYLRHQTVTESKLDAIHRRFDELMAIIIKKQ